MDQKAEIVDIFIATKVAAFKGFLIFASLDVFAHVLWQPFMLDCLISYRIPARPVTNIYVTLNSRQLPAGLGFINRSCNYSNFVW